MEHGQDMSSGKLWNYEHWTLEFWYISVSYLVCWYQYWNTGKYTFSPSSMNSVVWFIGLPLWIPSWNSMLVFAKINCKPNVTWKIQIMHLESMCTFMPAVLLFVFAATGECEGRRCALCTGPATCGRSTLLPTQLHSSGWLRLPSLHTLPRQLRQKRVCILCVPL